MVRKLSSYIGRQYRRRLFRPNGEESAQILASASRNCKYEITLRWHIPIVSSNTNEYCVDWLQHSLVDQEFYEKDLFQVIPFKILSSSFDNNSIHSSKIHLFIYNFLSVVALKRAYTPGHHSYCLWLGSIPSSHPVNRINAFLATCLYSPTVSSSPTLQPWKWSQHVLLKLVS